MLVLLPLLVVVVVVLFLLLFLVLLDDVVVVVVVLVVVVVVVAVVVVLPTQLIFDFLCTPENRQIDGVLAFFDTLEAKSTANTFFLRLRSPKPRYL